MATLLNPGDKVDDFLIEERLYVGGMAVIYRVHGPQSDSPLILKLPRLGFGEPATSVIGFETEQMVMQSLSGPHVPRLFAVGALERIPYLVMELIDGTRLHERMANGPLPTDEVAQIGVAIASAIHALHSQHVIHLDLNPGNVLFRESGEAVLVDFGLAHHSHYPDLMAEEFASPVGTPAYISPEQIFGVRCDPRSDLFSLGVLLYELSTGALPFGAPASRSGLRRRLYRDPVPPRALVPAIPEWLQEIILHCLEVDARQRYSSAAQVGFDLSHPDQVTIGERGMRKRRNNPWQVVRRWVIAAGFEPAPCPHVATHLSSAPIVLAAIATSHTNEARNQALRDAIRRALASEHDARLVLATVINPSSISSEMTEQDTATSRRIRNIVEMRQWIQPLHLPAERISFQVFEAGDPADALVEYARANHVDQIIIGSSPPAILGLKGTIAERVVAEAPCSVLVVRPGNYNERRDSFLPDDQFP